MKKYLAFVLIIAALLAILVAVKSRVGDIRPALLPPTSDIAQNVEETIQAMPGEAVDFPLLLPSGFTIGVFAKNLDNARDLAFSPSGTLLLSIPKQGKVVALPDKNNDGRADEVVDVVTRLSKPHGIAFYNGKLFVVEETQVIRYLWDEGSLTARQERVLFILPRGGNHTTRTIAFNKRGRIFISIGSTCDVCFEKHEWLAAVIVSDQDGNNPRLFARGLRNSVFITINPRTDELWGTEMGRDFLGDDLPPDEINIIRDTRDYGWPVCFGNKVYDTKFGQRSQAYCNNTEPPVYEIAAHSAPLGLTFINSLQFPTDWQGDLLVAYHGSWNRSTPIGYKVVRLDVEENRVVGEKDFITGFLPQGSSQALGRPVDFAFDKDGSLYISDDKAGVVYKVIRP